MTNVHISRTVAAILVAAALFAAAFAYMAATGNMPVKQAHAGTMVAD